MVSMKNSLILIIVTAVQVIEENTLILRKCTVKNLGVKRNDASNLQMVSENSVCSWRDRLTG